MGLPISLLIHTKIMCPSGSTLHKKILLSENARGMPATPYPVRGVSCQEGWSTPVLVLAGGRGYPILVGWRGRYPVLAMGKETPVLVLVGVYPPLGKDLELVSRGTPSPFYWTDTHLRIRSTCNGTIKHAECMRAKVVLSQSIFLIFTSDSLVTARVRSTTGR